MSWVRPRQCQKFTRGSPRKLTQAAGMERRQGEAEGQGGVAGDGGRAPTQVVRSAIARLVRVLCAHARSLLIVGSRVFCVPPPPPRHTEYSRPFAESLTSCARLFDRPVGDSTEPEQTPSETQAEVRGPATSMIELATPGCPRQPQTPASDELGALAGEWPPNGVHVCSEDERFVRCLVRRACSQTLAVVAWLRSSRRLLTADVWALPRGMESMQRYWSRKTFANGPPSTRLRLCAQGLICACPSRATRFSPFKRPTTKRPLQRFPFLAPPLVEYPMCATQR